MGRVRAPIAGRAPVDGDRGAGGRAPRGADGSVRRRDVPRRDPRGSGGRLAGDLGDPRTQADPGAHQRRTHRLRARRRDLAGLHLGRARARRVARRHPLLRGLPRAGRGDAGDRPDPPSGRPPRGRRRSHRRAHRGGGERAGPVEHRRPRDRHRHLDVGDDARRPRGIPRGRRRAPGAGAPGPLGAPPPGRSGLPLRGRRGLLACLRPRLRAVPGLGHGVGHSSTWAGWSAASWSPPPRGVVRARRRRTRSPSR